MEPDLTSMRHNLKAMRSAGAGAGAGRLNPGALKTARLACTLLGGGSAGSSAGAGAAGAIKDHHHHHNNNYRRKCVCAEGGQSSIHSIVSGRAGKALFPQVWNELRLNQQLCDGVIRCADGDSLKVHRAILSAVSPFFKALFTNSLSGGGGQEVCEVTLTECGAEALRPILDYAYTGQSGVTARTVERLLPLADRLGVVGVVQQCCSFLLAEMQPENCLGILRFARQYFCHDLEESGRRFVLHHFRKILHRSQELYDLTADELRRILADDELNVRGEEVVLEAVQRWVDRDAPARRQHLPELLACVRLGRMSLDFLNGAAQAYSSSKDDQATAEALERAREFLEANSGRDADLRHPLARPRVPFEILFAVGGWSAGSATNFVETYDCRADRWCLSSATDSHPRAYHGLAELDGLIYVVGGFDGVEHFNTVRSFNPVSREWREQACMYQARCFVSVCTLGGEIYALGGFDGRTRLNTAEVYNPQKNQWRLIPSMNRARSDASAATLNGKVYITGGFMGQEVLSSAEMFDPCVSQWTLISSMLSPRSGVSLVAHCGYLYALGGFNGQDRLSSGERFDGNIWQPIADMIHPRSNFAAVVLDDLIYVIGGFNGKQIVNYNSGTIIANTECLNIDKNEWTEVKQMNLNRSALSAVVLAGLPTAIEYSYLHILQREHCAEGQ
ncbi:Kelch-like protein 10 [Frankliniella fusca]|uniref:Kelch-like protein diablo n=1 Tax=Frankliniella fusca TaxID=407009 RepID=A0AAE1LFL8_9NEOP|nr:Kelch-like protein 10 [Frankliniella fusca]